MSVPPYLISGMILEFFVISFSKTPNDWSSNDWFFLGPHDLIKAVIDFVITAALISLVLRSAQIVTKWRTRGMAVFVLFALEVLRDVLMGALGEFRQDQFHPVLGALVSLVATASIILVVNYNFCLGSQILVDGRANLSRSNKDVARRGWRLWLSLLLVNLVSTL
jgi:hypothetical protein